jgi:hypothetical protein
LPIAVFEQMMDATLQPKGHDSFGPTEYYNLDSAEEPQLAKNQHQERPSKHPRQKSKSFVRHLRAIFFGLFSRKQMVFPKTGGCSAESLWIPVRWLGFFSSVFRSQSKPELTLC